MTQDLTDLRKEMFHSFDKWPNQLAFLRFYLLWVSHDIPSGFIDFSGFALVSVHWYTWTELQTSWISNSHLVCRLAMETAQVKSDTKYQKEIDRYFALIYHNLKRIQDNTIERSKRGSCHTEPLNRPGSQKMDYLEGNSHCVKEDSTSTKNRRVSFSADINQTHSGFNWMTFIAIRHWTWGN